MTISTAILHTPWIPERKACLGDMLRELAGSDPLEIFKDPKPEGMAWSEFKTRLAAAQWGWALNTNADHCLFLTDDLELAPGFWGILKAMRDAEPGAIIGLLSNHPQGPELWAEGHHWYRCNSWIVGPAYMVPREALAKFLPWYLGLPDNEAPGGRRWYNDDSALNEWISSAGPAESWHPLPTIIKHRGDVASTVGHGDKFSRERISWDTIYEVSAGEFGAPTWEETRVRMPLDEMARRSYWMADRPPLLKVGG